MEVKRSKFQSTRRHDYNHTHRKEKECKQAKGNPKVEQMFKQFLGRGWWKAWEVVMNVNKEIMTKRGKGARFDIDGRKDFCTSQKSVFALGRSFFLFLLCVAAQLVTVLTSACCCFLLFYFSFLKVVRRLPKSTRSQFFSLETYTSVR